jgi:hypothetical protein
VVSEALLRLLVRKGTVTRSEIRETVQKLENAGRDMAGAVLVAAAWKDPSFKKRLLEDGPFI